MNQGVGTAELCGSRLTPSPCFMVFPVKPDLNRQEDATPSEQFSPANPMESVTAGVSPDTTGLVHPQYAITGVAASVPQINGPLPHLDEFAVPVHQEQIVAEETTQNFGEIQR